MMSEKIKRLEKYAPLGIGVGSQVAWYIVGAVAATLHSMWFLVEYLQARNELYVGTASGLQLIEGAVIKDFVSLAQPVFLSFYIVAIVTFLTAIFFYFYHYDGSNMMYLMKRLPDKRELYRRVLTLPIAGVVVLMLWMIILKALYYAIYIMCTPIQCLPLPV